MGTSPMHLCLVRQLLVLFSYTFSVYVGCEDFISYTVFHAIYHKYLSTVQNSHFSFLTKSDRFAVSPVATCKYTKEKLISAITLHF